MGAAEAAEAALACGPREGVVVWPGQNRARDWFGQQVRAGPNRQIPPVSGCGRGKEAGRPRKGKQAGGLGCVGKKTKELGWGDWEGRGGKKKGEREEEQKSTFLEKQNKQIQFKFKFKLNLKQ